MLYPYYRPSERYLLAEGYEASAFTPLVAGLLREAGVRQRDELVGVSDGALWIERLFERVGVTTVYKSRCWEFTPSIYAIPANPCKVSSLCQQSPPHPTEVRSGANHQ